MLPLINPPREPAVTDLPLDVDWPVAVRLTDGTEAEGTVYWANDVAICLTLPDGEHASFMWGDVTSLKWEKPSWTNMWGRS